MGLSRRQLQALFLCGLFLGFGAVLAGHYASSGMHSGQGFVSASSSGPTIALPPGATEWNHSGARVSDTELRLETHGGGNATVISNGDTKASADSLTGPWANFTALDVSSAELFIDPDDRPAVNISGSPTRFDYRDSMGVGDGTIDFVYEGASGSTTVTLRNLPADRVLGAVDQNGNVLATAMTDSSGTLTFSSMPNSKHTVRITEADETQAPVLSNASPQGTQGNFPSSLSVDVDDPDFPDDNVTVEFVMNGTTVGADFVDSSAGTASVPISNFDRGTHNVTANATDEYGNSVETDWQFGVANYLYIRNETRPSNQLNESVDVTFYTEDRDPIFTRTSPDGSRVDMQGLPGDDAFFVTARTERNFTTRTVHIEDIADQRTIYLLNTTAHETISTRFVLSDSTGSYPSEESMLHVKRDINSTFTRMYSDLFGTEGVTVTLQDDKRYRLTVESPENVTQSLGPYRSNVNETVELRPEAAAVRFDEYTERWGYGSEIENGTLQWSYFDNQNQTDRLKVFIHERGNTSVQLRANETFYNLGNASGQVALTQSEQNQEWTVRFEIVRDGEDLVAQSTTGNIEMILPEGLDDGWRMIIGVSLLLLFGGAFSMLNRGVGAVMLAVTGGILYITGWLEGATTAGAIIIALFIGVIYHLYLSRP